MRVALLTGGGDCPGLNAVIYAAVKKGINKYGDEFVGFLNGWRGVLDNKWIPLTLERIDGIQLTGGTILHSSRVSIRRHFAALPKKRMPPSSTLSINLARRSCGLGSVRPTRNSGRATMWAKSTAPH